MIIWSDPPAPAVTQCLIIRELKKKSCLPPSLLSPRSPLTQLTHCNCYGRHSWHSVLYGGGGGGGRWWWWLVEGAGGGGGGGGWLLAGWLWPGHTGASSETSLGERGDLRPAVRMEISILISNWSSISSEPHTPHSPHSDHDAAIQTVHSHPIPPGPGLHKPGRYNMKYNNTWLIVMCRTEPNEIIMILIEKALTGPAQVLPG